MAKFTHVGRFRDRVQFKSIQSIQGEWGLEETEVIIGSYYCELRSQNLTEAQKNIGTVLEDTLTLIIRYQEGLNIESDMVATVNGVTYEVIKHTPDISRKQFDTIILRARS